MLIKRIEIIFYRMIGEPAIASVAAAFLEFDRDNPAEVP